MTATTTEKKAPRKSAKPAKASAKTPKAKSSGAVPTTPRARKEGLRAPQVRILTALSQCHVPMTSKDVAKDAKVDPAWVADNLYGRLDPQERKARESKTGYPSLLTLGFVKVKELKQEDGKAMTVYEITATGKKALAKMA